VLAHYEYQTEEEAVGEDEAAYEDPVTLSWRSLTIWSLLFVSSSPRKPDNLHRKAGCW